MKYFAFLHRKCYGPGDNANQFVANRTYIATVTISRIATPATNPPIVDIFTGEPRITAPGLNVISQEVDEDDNIVYEIVFTL